MMKNNLLSIQDLQVFYYTRYGAVKAVDGVNLTLKPNETLGLVGESGCGKSTIAHSILRLIKKPGRINSGKILFHGEDLVNVSEEEIREIRGGKIAMIFQDPMASLNPVLTVKDQVGEVIKLHQNVEKADLPKSIAKILNEVGIPDVKKVMASYPHELSGGMQQRVMIAMALSCNPEILIAD